MSEPSLYSKDQVFTYLEQNEEVAREYFTLRAKSQWVDEWLYKRSHRPSLQQHTGNIQAVLTAQTNTATNTSSPSNLLLKPLKTGRTIEGHKKLQQIFNRDECASKEQDKSDVASRAELASKLSEMDLFMALIRDVSEELDVNSLSHKILVNVSLLTNGDRCSLFLLKGSHEKQYLVSRLFDVTIDSTLESSLKPEGKEIIVPVGVGVAGTSAQTGETININNAYEDPRFNSEVDKHTGYTTHSILCMPIKNPEGKVIGVAEIINKRNGDHEFTKKDEEVFRNYLTFCGIGLTNAQLFDISVQEYKRNQILLNLARHIFEDAEQIDVVVRRIMTQAKESLDVERCNVYIVDNENEDVSGEVVFSKVFDMTTEEDVANNSNKKGSLSDNVYQGIAAHVAKSGQIMNITDVEKSATDINIMSGDNKVKPKAKCMLCMPISNRQNIVVGVAQLINKNNGHPFTEDDEIMFEAFAMFCGLGIHNTLQYENTCKMLAKQKLSMEILSYHASASDKEADRFQRQIVPPASQFDLSSFQFDDIPLSDKDTLLASIRMFLEFELLDKFRIPHKVLCRWLLTVRKNYRPVIYHNWRHAFNVAQTMFTMLTTGHLKVWFSDLEAFVLLVACFCHDLDHRGTNNTFQTKADSPLSQLYSTSTMEHHHFDHSIMILNSEGNNIFAALSSTNYKKAIGTLEHAILSTDLAIYFKKRGEFQRLIESGEADWTKEHDRTVLRAMMMTACDISAITKPWPVQQRVAELVASEFFEQGDMERSVLNAEPIPMMDRAKKDDLPKMQVGFIDFVCMPVYELFYKMDENLKPMYDGILNNRKNWQRLSEEREKKSTEEGSKALAGNDRKQTNLQPDKPASTEDVDASKANDMGSSTQFPEPDNNNLNIPKDKEVKRVSFAANDLQEHIQTTSKSANSKFCVIM